MSNLYVVVPARSGSESVPDKNFRDFAGSSLVDLALEAANSISIAKEVIFSTDHASGEARSQFFGCTFHKRSPELSESSSQVADLLMSIATEYKLNDDDVMLILEPTSPLRKMTDVFHAAEIFAALPESGRKSIFSVSEVQTNSRKILRIDESSGIAYPSGSGTYGVGNRQSLEPEYAADGGFYMFKLKELRKSGQVPISHCTAFRSSNLMIDINTEYDFVIAETLYSLSKSEEDDNDVRKKI